MKRRNAMEISVKGLMLAVTVVISLILSAVALYLVTGAKGMISQGNSQFTQMINEYSENDAIMYDGTVLTGSKVMDVIEEMSAAGNVNVKVITKANRTGVVYGKLTSVTPTPSADTYSAQNIASTSADYINPNGSFESQVTTNGNGIVTMITFTQI